MTDYFISVIVCPDVAHVVTVLNAADVLYLFSTVKVTLSTITLSVYVKSR